MKSFIKGFLGILSLLILVSIFTTITSCNEREENKLSPQTNSFLQFYSKNYKNLVTQNIVDAASNRNYSKTLEQESVVIYADFPQDTQKEIQALCSEVKTPNDISTLHRETAVEFSYTKTPSTKDSIVVNKIKVKQSIKPIIQESKTYLKSIGFSDKEIQDMLIENKSDESQLVTLVMLLVSNEVKQTETAQSAIKDPLHLLFTPIYANDNNILMRNVFDCGLEALGANVLVALGQSTAKTWSKAVIKSVFKTVAKKVVGPIGVAIAVVDFGLCMHRKGYTCIYTTQSPITDKINALSSSPFPYKK